MNDALELVKHIYVALRLDQESDEVWLSDRLVDWIDEIEQELGKAEMDLFFERFRKTDRDLLYKGAKVRVKKDMYYGELFNDPKGESPYGSAWLSKGTEAEVIEVGTDIEADPEQYYDCVVMFSVPYMMRVEWLDFLEDDDED